MRLAKMLKGWLANVAPPVAVLVAVVLLMEWALKAFKVKAFLVPRPSAIWLRLETDWRLLLEATWETAKPALIGFAGSVVVGVTAAILLASSRWVRRAFYPYTLFFQTVPIVAIAPLLVIWLGFGLPAIATSAFVVSVFPVIANTLSGLLSVDPALRDMFRLYRAGAFATLVKLRLPSALPHILTGMRIAAGLAVIGTIVGEFVASFTEGAAGLGILIMAANRNGEVDLMFAAVLVSSLLGLVIFLVINLLSWLLLRHWHSSEQDR